MITAVVLACSVALNVCLSLVVLKVSLTGFSKLSESHERTTSYTEGLIDRLMANDYSAYQDRQLSSSVAKYGFPPLPDDPADDFEPSMGPDRGGFGSRLGLVALSHPEDEMDIESEMAARGDR